VATSEGEFYVGNIDPRDGGECRVTKEFKLLLRPGEFMPPPQVLQEADDTTAHVRMFCFHFALTIELELETLVSLPLYV